MSAEFVKCVMFISVVSKTFYGPNLFYIQLKSSNI